MEQIDLEDYIDELEAKKPLILKWKVKESYSIGYINIEAAKEVLAQINGTT